MEGTSGIKCGLMVYPLILFKFVRKPTLNMISTQNLNLLSPKDQSQQIDFPLEFIPRLIGFAGFSRLIYLIFNDLTQLIFANQFCLSIIKLTTQTTSKNVFG
jgi:hypothetical protein